ncbi:MAG: DUF2442 domain-containing protein [Deferribacteres bacterium]|nr:DUF2442 domain-containing protein [candidate division KSB1 bacterium]MCB9509365.1 DUF2442 domain-containing protein [Deferribacteres bacterium]
MLLEIKAAEYIDDYRIFLEFNDGYKAAVDLKEVLQNEQRKIFEPLKNPHYFKRFSLRFNTICWQNDVDFAPEFLYDLAKKQQSTNVSA